MKATQNDIVLKATDFRYPSKEESKSINETFIEPFGFESIHEITAILNRIPIKTVHKNKLLAEWDNHLINKAGNLYSSYQNSLVHFHRIINASSEVDKNYKIVNRIQFDFFSEVYFYFFQGMKDTTAQILNLYFDLGLNEKQISFNKIQKRLIKNNTAVHILSQKLLDNTEKATEIRNSFTHRFPSSYPDFRPTLTVANSSVTYNAGTGKHISIQEMADNIASSYIYI